LPYNILNTRKFNIMLVGDKNYQSIWLDESDPSVVKVIDQRKLPFFFEISELRTVDDIYNSIRDMIVRGAPLIGAAGAFGIYLATLEITSNTNVRLHLENAARYLISSRPTAVNLSWAVNYVLGSLDKGLPVQSLSPAALESALFICEKEKNSCREIGRFGLPLIKAISVRKKGESVNILTHCNAGWLACIDYGTVTAPIYLAHDSGIPVHVWIDETRPRNQGAKLTAWELGQAGVPHTLITDNTGGHLMQHGMVDIVFVGCDRATAKGDVANKIGTYLKALAAFENKIPFYSVLPSSSIDFGISDGVSEILIEERDAEEVTTVSGFAGGKIVSVRICPENTPALNFGFDVTPAKYISGLITEKGICRASEKNIKEMFSEKFN
jgi:methylthioribose-1-phosphate isomerase